MSLIDDHELRRRFAELREADRAAAPSVDATLGRARSPRRTARRIYTAAVVLGTAALAVLVISLRHRDAGQPPVIVGIMEWRPVTDVLLRTARPTLLGPMPPLGTSVLDSLIR